MKLIKYEFTEGDERLSSHSGLALIGALLNRTRLKERLTGTILPYCREPKISHSDIVYAATGLMCLGKPDYDAIEPFRRLIVKFVPACAACTADRQAGMQTGKNGFGVSSVERSVEPLFFSHALILNENPHKSTVSFITAK